MSQNAAEADLHNPQDEAPLTAKERRRRGLFLLLIPLLIVLAVLACSWLGTYNLMPGQVPASGLSLLEANYLPWPRNDVSWFELDFQRLATAAAQGADIWSPVDASQPSPTTPPLLAPLTQTASPTTQATEQISPTPTIIRGASTSTPLPLPSPTLTPIPTSTATDTPPPPPPPPPSADLSLNMVDAPDPVLLGNNLTYTLTVTNNGPDTAMSVTLTQNLPGGVVFVSAAPSQGSCNEVGGVVTCNLGNIASGGTEQVTVTITTNAAGIINSTASVAASTADPNNGNNNAAENTLVNSPPVAVDDIVTTTENTATTIYVLANDSDPDGDPLTITSVGPTSSPDTTATINDNGTPGDPTDDYIDYTPTNNFNGVDVFTYQICDPYLACATATISVSVQPDSLNIGPPDNAWHTIPCGSPPLILDLGGSPIVTHNGFDFVYYEHRTGAQILMDWVIVEIGTSPYGPWYEIFNWGDDLTDTNTNIGQLGYGSPPGPGSEPSNHPIPTTDPPLYGPPPWITGILIDVDAVAPSGTYQWVRLSAAPACVGGEETEVDALQTLPYYETDLRMSKVVSNPNPPTGTNVTYTITVTNDGPDNASGVVLTDLLPGGVVHVSNTGGGAYNPVTGEWVVGNLANSASASLNITVTVTGPAGTPIINQAQVTYSDQYDPDPGDDADTATITPV